MRCSLGPPHGRMPYKFVSHSIGANLHSGQVQALVNFSPNPTIWMKSVTHASTVCWLRNIPRRNNYGSRDSVCWPMLSNHWKNLPYRWTKALYNGVPP